MTTNWLERYDSKCSVLACDLRQRDLIPILQRIDFQNEKQRQQNAEMVAMKEESSRKVQIEKLKIEEQIQVSSHCMEKRLPASRVLTNAHCMPE